MRVGVSSDNDSVVLLSETVKLLPDPPSAPQDPQRELFPEDRTPPTTIITGPRTPVGSRTIVNKVPGGNDCFNSEVHGEPGKGWAPAFKLGPRRSALANMPEDESKFPASTWLRGLLADGVRQVALDSSAMRRASPPRQGPGYNTDGSNLPWVVERLRSTEPDRFKDWLSHLGTALPDLEDVLTVERADDRHRYLQLQYRGGLRVPSWTTSDGTLRLLALTLLAYLPDLRGVYLIEEPENGIHPRAVETMYQSLSNVYGAQILMATHSPVVLSMAEPRQVLCFAKTESGATDVVSGDRHPMLREWRGGLSLSTLFVGGVLG